MCTLSKYWVKFKSKHQLTITFLCPYGCDKMTLFTFYDMENIKYCTEIQGNNLNTNFLSILLMKIHILWPNNGLLGNNNATTDT